MAKSRLGSLPDDTPFDAPSPREQRELGRQARERDDELAEIFELGRKEGADEARPSSASVPRSGRRARGSLSREAAALAVPLRRHGRQGVRLLAMTLGVIALYLVTERGSIQAGVGVIDAANRALVWLREPRGIPYFDPLRAPGAGAAAAPTQTAPAPDPLRVRFAGSQTGR